MTSGRSGFSLLELSLALSISGMMMAGAWQLVTTTSQQADARNLADNALIAAQAAQNYLNSNRETLLALPGLASLNSAVKVKMTSADTGSTANSVQEAGLLSTAYTNTNAYGQSYAFYVKRIDAGQIGIADAGDRLQGVLITTGGSSINDRMGANVAASLGAAGGFMFDEGNPNPPTAATTARGSNGGWSLPLSSAPWSSLIGTTGTAGRIAIMTGLLANGSNITATSGGAKSIDALSDGITSYNTNGTLYMGNNSGPLSSATANNNTALGYNAMAGITTGDDNSAIGFNTLGFSADSTNNTALGYRALEDVTTGSYNVGAGAYALANVTTGANNVAMGYQALQSNTASDNTAAGAGALYLNVSGTANTAIGKDALRNNTASNNTAVGSEALYANTIGTGNTGLGYHTLRNNINGSYNSALGALALYTLNGGSYNTAVGYSALYTNASGSNNTALGNLSLYSNTGTGNTAAGTRADYYATGSYNTTMGRDAGSATNAGGNNGNTSLGEEALRYSTGPSCTTAVGTMAAQYITTGLNNTALGSTSLANVTTGGYNTGVGAASLDAITAGTYNTAIGINALGGSAPASNGNNHVSYNVAVGFQTLTANGQRTNANVAIGTNALMVSSTGLGNVAVGFNVMGASNTAGSQNTAIGNTTLRNVTGSRNTAIGGVAGRYLATANDNTLAGFLAGSALTNVSGDQNTAVGFNAFSTTATGVNGVVAIGYNALKANSYNLAVAVGAGAGQEVTSGGAGSVFFGKDTGKDIRGGANNTAFGFESMLYSDAGYSGSNNTAFGSVSLPDVYDSEGNTAIGDDAMPDSQDSAYNTAAGYSALGASGLTGQHNIAIGYNTLTYITSGNNNIAIGYNAGPGSSGAGNSNTVTIGNGATTTTGNSVRFGNTAITLITGQVAWTAVSDRRDKKDIKDTDLGLDFIMKLRPVSYRLNGGNERLDYGFVAQEVEEALEGRQANLIIRENDERRSYLFRSNDLIAPVVKALQQQDARSSHNGAALEATQATLDKTDMAAIKTQLEQNAGLLAKIEARLAAHDNAKQ